MRVALCMHITYFIFGRFPFTLGVKCDFFHKSIENEIIMIISILQKDTSNCID